MVRWIYIHLTRGRRTIIDIEDYPRVKQQCKWLARKKKNKYYAEGEIINKDGKKQQIYLSHFILNFDKDLPESKGMVVDHKNRDPEDNRKRNLRVVTRQINAFNISPRENSKTGVVGIYEYQYGYSIKWSEDGETFMKYFPLGKNDKMTVFWEAYDFYFNTISNIELYRQAFCFDEPEQNNGTPDDYIDEDDYEYIINPRMKNRNELENYSGHRNITIQGRLLRFQMTINGEYIEEYFHFDKEYKGDLRDQTNQTWINALAFFDEMLKKKKEIKKKKLKKEKYEDEFISEIYFENRNESVEMEIETEEEQKHNMMDLIIYDW